MTLLKKSKSLELTVYDDLRFVLPSDYVNWVKALFVSRKYFKRAY